LSIFEDVWPNDSTDNDVGTIEEDRLAGILVVSEDPLQEIGKTREINLVIKDGTILVNRPSKAQQK